MATNVYDDPERARAYAELEFPGSYYVAFRDIAFHADAAATLDASRCAR